MAVAPDSIDRVETIEEVAALPNIDGAVALLAQTTLSHRDWSSVAEAVRVKYPQVWSPGKSDLCFATTNRQSALMEIASKCDTVVVIGSSNSSNTMALARLATDLGCKQVLRVNSEEEIPLNLSGTVGVTAGASAPEELVTLVLKRLNPENGVTEVRITTEDEYFPPPRNIRSLQQAVERAAKTMVGGAASLGTLIDDRSISASRVLEQLQSTA
jgi:4-hydroxy-3-methylbut-2-enyl diphosphate reductase